MTTFANNSAQNVAQFLASRGNVLGVISRASFGRLGVLPRRPPIGLQTSPDRPPTSSDHPGVVCHRLQDLEPNGSDDVYSRYSSFSPA